MPNKSKNSNEDMTPTKPPNTIASNTPDPPREPGLHHTAAASRRRRRRSRRRRRGCRGGSGGSGRGSEQIVLNAHLSERDSRPHSALAAREHLAQSFDFRFQLFDSQRLRKDKTSNDDEEGTRKEKQKKQASLWVHDQSRLVLQVLRTIGEAQCGHAVIERHGSRAHVRYHQSVRVTA